MLFVDDHRVHQPQILCILEHLYLAEVLKVWRFICAALLLSWSLVANALDAMITLPVSDETQATLFQAAPKAMQQVLVSMTGNTNVASLPAVRAALAQANQWIQSFSYSTTTVNNVPTLQVTIQFNSQALSQLLTEAQQQPVWQLRRPLTLAWVVTDDNPSHTNSTHMPAATSDQSDVSTSLKSSAAQFGMPLILPMMDLQDQNFINNNTALPFDVTKLTQAAARYHVTAVLAAHLHADVDGSWQAQWLYLLNNQPQQWHSEAATLALLMQQGISHANAMLLNSLVNSQASLPIAQVTMQILGVNNLNDYALILNDLKQIQVIVRILVSQLNATALTLQLGVRGGEPALAKALQTDPHFIPGADSSFTTESVSYQFKSN